MSYRIIFLTESFFFTKILILSITPFFFISVGVLCEFSMVPDVYNLLSPRRRGSIFFLRGIIYTPAGNCMFKVNNRNTRTRC